LSTTGSAISTSCRLAIIASAVVNANDASASGAPILHLLRRKKISHTILCNLLQVLHHAHIVFGSVSLIQMFQILAGKIVTSKTEPYFAFVNSLAVLNLASNNGNGFVGTCCPATGAFVFFSQIGHANATVHTTGCDQAFFYVPLLSAVAQLLPRKCSTKLANSSRSSQPSFR
jgi:hypothetical protein